MSSAVRSKASVLVVLVAVSAAGMVAVAPAASASASSATVSKLQKKLRESRAEKHALRQTLQRARARLGELSAVKAVARTALGGSGGLRNRLHEVKVALGRRGSPSPSLQHGTSRQAEITRASDINTEIESLTNEIDPGSTTLASAVFNVSNLIGVNPSSGSLAGDLMTVTNEINPGSASLESAVFNVSFRIGVDPSSGSLAGDIGAPRVSGNASSLADVIGGQSGGSLASALGDPVIGATGLSGLIRAGGGAAGTVNGFNTAPFYDAITLRGQLQAFPSVLDQSEIVASSQIEIPKTSGFLSLAAVLANLNHD